MLVTKGATAVTWLYEKAVAAANFIQRAFNDSVNANLWGLIISAVTAVVSAIILFRENLQQSNKDIREFNSALVSQRQAVDDLFGALAKANDNIKARSELIKQINELYGQYLPNILTENSSLNEIAAAQQMVNSALEYNLALKSQQTAIENILNKNIETRAKATSDILERITKKNGNLTKQASDDLNQIIETVIQKGYVAYEDYQKFISKYPVADIWKSGYEVMDRNLEDILAAEKSKNEELIKIKSAYSGFLEKGDQNIYLRELQQLNDSFTQKKIAYEKYLKDVEILKNKHGVKLTDNTNVLDNTTFQNNISDGSGSSGDSQSMKERIAEKEALERLRQWNLEVLAEGRKKAEKELDYWRENELAKIKSGKESQETKEKEIFAIGALYKKKWKELDDKYNADLLKELERQKNFLIENNAKIAKSREEMMAYDIAAINAKYQNEIDKANETAQSIIDDEDLKQQFLQTAADLETARVAAVNAYRINAAENFEKDKLAVLEKYGILSDKEKYENELIQLEQYYKDGLIDYEKYLKAKEALDKAYNDQLEKNNAETQNEIWNDIYNSFQKQKEITSVFSDFFQSAKEAELSAVGENEEEKKRIQKKYADVELAINIAMIIADTASAIAKAMKFPFPVNLVMAALYAGIGAAQGIKAVNARNTIKQLAKGKYPVIGEDDGKTYHAEYAPSLKTGIIAKPTLVAEEPEMVIDNRTLYDTKKDRYGMTVMDHARSIMSIKYGRVRQFAEGKYDNVSGSKTQKPQAAADAQTIQLLYALISEIQGLRSDVKAQNMNIRAQVVLSDIETATQKMADAKAKVTL